ncbi:DUF3862 domain-containing protein [Clostridium sp.]
MNEFLTKHVIGFRSNLKWKMVVAIVYYLFCTVLLLAVGIGAFLITVTIPYTIFAIIGIINNEDKKKVLIMLLCGILLFSIGFKIDNSRQVKETKTKQITEQNKIMADKKAKEVADAKIISDAKDKVIADKKAIEDKKIADAQVIKDKETARLQAIADKKEADKIAIEEAKDEEDRIAKETAGKMTKAKFNKLKSGMSYAQVTKIMGGEGEVLSESGSEGDEYYTVMIMYEGIGSLGANANIMMQGDKLQNKAQLGCE